MTIDEARARLAADAAALETEIAGHEAEIAKLHERMALVEGQLNGFELAVSLMAPVEIPAADNAPARRPRRDLRAMAREYIVEHGVTMLGEVADRLGIKMHQAQTVLAALQKTGDILPAGPSAWNLTHRVAVLEKDAAE